MTATSAPPDPSEGESGRTGLLGLLWHSPTFTTWANFAAQTLSLLGVTSLVLLRFDALEVAAYYLFSTVVSLAAILVDRMGLTFVRLYAFAVAGARDLRPIAGAGQASGKPDWQSLSKVWGTSGWIFLVYALLIAGVCLAMGLYGLNNLAGTGARSHDPSGAVPPLLTTLVLVVAGTAISIFLRLYDMALRGFDKVALANRWAALFGLLRGLAAIATLLAGGRLLSLIAVTQLTILIQGLTSRWLVARSLPRLAQSRLFNFDRGVVLAAWKPTWLGLLGQFSHTGVSQLSGIVFTAHGDPAVVGGYLLALRFSTTLVQVAQSPFVSRQPAFSSLRARGQLGELRIQVEKRILFSLGLFAVGGLAVAVSVRPLLALLEASVDFVPTPVWLVLALLVLHDRFNILELSVCATGNHIIYNWQQVVAGGISLVALFWLIGPWGLWGIVLATGLPRTLMLLAGPSMAAADSLGVSTWGHVRRAYLPVLAGFVVMALLILLLEL